MNNDLKIGTIVKILSQNKQIGIIKNIIYNNIRDTINNINDICVDFTSKIGDTHSGNNENTYYVEVINYSSAKIDNEKNIKMFARGELWQLSLQAGDMILCDILTEVNSAQHVNQMYGLIVGVVDTEEDRANWLNNIFCYRVECGNTTINYYAM